MAWGLVVKDLSLGFGVFKVALGVPLRVPSRFAVRFPLKGIRVSAF